MKELLLALKEAFRHEDTLCLATVSASSGATPRGEGARMLVGRTGRIYGTVGGGAVEFHSIEMAKAQIAEGKNMQHYFRLVHNQVEDIGMICGGDVRIHFQILRAGDPVLCEMLDRGIALCEERSAAFLVQDLSENAPEPLWVWQRGAHFFGHEKEHELLAELDCRLTENSRSKTRVVIGDSVFFAEELSIPGFVYVFGGGHVAQALVPVLAGVGFAVVVCEDRDEFLDPALFKGAREVARINFSDIFATLDLTASDYICIMTRGHHYDEELQYQVLQSPVRYIGVIGSRHKRKTVDKHLMERGVPEEQLKRIHSPIGLDIGGETPEEIAISITAELIQERSHGE